ncbi:MAG: hypothetical protein JKY02_02775 [Flavobacteriaceae bacterium]|nr:hypothetical protein [Flavobacteriaceae bacterium]
MIKNKFHKLFHWEHWSLLMFYIPNIPYAFFHGIKIRSLVFYTAVNPGIKNAGIGSESKYETLQILPDKYIPKSVFHAQNQNIELTIQKIAQEGITYPLIVKPDVGFRGLLVQKIENETALKTYLTKYPVAIIIQEFLTHKNECGIFYYRLPNEEFGKVTSITLKEFLTVKGDGISTLKELVLNDQRAFLYFHLLQENSLLKWEDVLKKGVSKKLSSIGNHSKGTRFINGNHLINKKLETSLDTLNHQAKGWYYGRLDVKYNTLEELNNGDFKVLEINGILAEPTHIYDASKTTYLKALKTIRTHWKQLYRIAHYNHKQQGVPFRKTIPFIKEMLALKAYSNRLKKLSKK